MSEAQSEREFFRAPASLYVFYGPESLQSRQAMAMDAGLLDTQSDLEAAARQILEGTEAPENLRPIFKVLRWLDYKLDMILHQMRQADRQALFPRHLETVDISGCGFGISEAGDLKTGQRIILAMSLPDAPTRTIYAVGQVARVSEEQVGEKQAQAAVQFVEISDNDRERIIRFTFNQQRRLLANRAQGAES